MVYEKHEFALYYKDLSADKNHSSLEITIDDEMLLHRLVHVLRLGEGEVITLFDETCSIKGALKKLTKKGALIQVHDRKKQSRVQPLIHWLVPLLDREALEEVITSLTVMGAATITFFTSEKSRSRLVLTPDRIHRLMIAAAEQSKQFVFPLCGEKVGDLAMVINQQQPAKPLIFFDADGAYSLPICNQLHEQKITELTCLIGPEGDFTTQEKEFLRLKGAQFCALTPSVLRAEVAVTVAMGILRTCLRQDA